MRVTLTAWANDVGYDEVFARQVEAFGQPGDVLVGDQHQRPVAQHRAGAPGGQAARPPDRRAARRRRRRGPHYAETALVVPSDDPQHIQEVHLVILHLLGELVDRAWRTREGAAEALTTARRTPRGRLLWKTSARRQSPSAKRAMHVAGRRSSSSRTGTSGGTHERIGGADGKVALVTGGGRGLGDRICRMLVAAGATVVAGDIRPSRDTGDEQRAEPASRST